MTGNRLEGAPLTRGERRRLENVLDRVEDRLRDATPGVHAWGPPAAPRELAVVGMPPGAALLWQRWDGLDLAAGEARIHPVARIPEATRAAGAAGSLREGDLVVGERGRDLYVLPADPWEEGAEVVLVEEAGDRWPDATSVPHLVLGLLGEVAVLYDDEGEFRDELFSEEDGELTERAERRLLRRRLDLDPDAPLPRYRLAVVLRQAGETRAAIAELGRVLNAAPSFAWAHHEHGRSLLDLGQPAEAARAFREAAEAAGDPDLRTHFLAWAALASGDPQIREQVRELNPAFVAQAVAGVEQLLEREQLVPARELASLGLAVQPGNVELLALRGRLDALT